MFCVSSVLTFGLVYFLCLSHVLVQDACRSIKHLIFGFHIIKWFVCERFLKRGWWEYGYSDPTPYNVFMLNSLPVAVPDVTKHPNWHLLEHDNCGISMSDRIIGGKNASLGQFPWLARIGYVSTNDDQRRATPNYKCGGALINKMYVLTAAHCVTSLPGKYIVSTVRLGENNVLTDVDCEDDVCAAAVQDFRPKRLIVHKEYGMPPYKNDIALIRLDRPAYFNGWVQPICVPHGVQLAQNYEGTKAQVAGWGVYDMNNPKASHYLLYVTLPVVDLDRCVTSFRKHAKIGTTQLCVGGIVGEDSCGGDSGGPLSKVEAVHGTPKYYILGIVSFGAKHCGATTMPAIYTRMASYVIWVLDNLLP